MYVRFWKCMIVAYIRVGKQHFRAEIGGKNTKVVRITKLGVQKRVGTYQIRKTMLINAQGISETHTHTHRFWNCTHEISKLRKN